ncbi:MAG: type II toxin-antitoxin system RelB/DinJ family antitoxin [Clostridia bacterium]|nr:type II toxin-antitoxin system RelB/DinJ family antitoxin [Clostridia bacterium]
MAKTAVINVRVEPELKQLAEDLYKSFGITITDAINLFLNKSVMEGGLPFELKQPRYNAETEAAMAEADAILDGRAETKAYKSAGELFRELDRELKEESR